MVDHAVCIHSATVNSYIMVDEQYAIHMPIQSQRSEDSYSQIGEIIEMVK